MCAADGGSVACVSVYVCAYIRCVCVCACACACACECVFVYVQQVVVWGGMCVCEAGDCEVFGSEDGGWMGGVCGAVYVRLYVCGRRECRAVCVCACMCMGGVCRAVCVRLNVCGGKECASLFGI